MKTWHIRLDMQKQYDNEIIEIVTQDTYSNELIIHLVNNGRKVSFSDIVLVAIIFDKSDGTQVIGSCKVVRDGLVKYVVDYQALTALGITTVTLKLIDGQSVETSTSFIINVIADPYFGTNGSIISTSEYPILTQTILDNQALKVILQGWINNPEQFIGPIGPKGDQGPQGIQGLTGPQGIQGERGLQGIEGNVGPRGFIGETGPKGDVGLTGPKGDIGPQGIKGDIGLTGLKGDTGSKGDKGDTGIMGPKGDTGDKGNKGDIGLPGAVIQATAPTENIVWLDTTEDYPALEVEDRIINLESSLTSHKLDYVEQV